MEIPSWQCSVLYHGKNERLKVIGPLVVPEPP